VTDAPLKPCEFGVHATAQRWADDAHTTPSFGVLIEVIAMTLVFPNQGQLETEARLWLTAALR
jgi:hypothetical protein